MPQAKGNAFRTTEVSEPLPGEDTFDAADHILTIGSKDAQQRVRGRRQIFMDENRAVLIENTDVPRLRL